VVVVGSLVVESHALAPLKIKHLPPVVPLECHVDIEGKEGAPRYWFGKIESFRLTVSLNDYRRELEQFQGRRLWTKSPAKLCENLTDLTWPGHLRLPSAWVVARYGRHTRTFQAWAEELFFFEIGHNC
jgi:hypothetical protein